MRVGRGTRGGGCERVGPRCLCPADLSLLQEDLQEEIDGCEWGWGAAGGCGRARKWLRAWMPTVHCGRGREGERRRRPCSALPAVHEAHRGGCGASRAPPGAAAGAPRKSWRRAAGCVGSREEEEEKGGARAGRRLTGAGGRPAGRCGSARPAAAAGGRRGERVTAPRSDGRGGRGGGRRSRAGSTWVAFCWGCAPRKGCGEGREGDLSGNVGPSAVQSAARGCGAGCEALLR